jgi:hypothetical protein
MTLYSRLRLSIAVKRLLWYIYRTVGLRPAQSLLREQHLNKRICCRFPRQPRLRGVKRIRYVPMEVQHVPSGTWARTEPLGVNVAKRHTSVCGYACVAQEAVGL